jgi:hypothetical protein
MADGFVGTPHGLNHHEIWFLYVFVEPPGGMDWFSWENLRKATGFFQQNQSNEVITDGQSPRNCGHGHLLGEIDHQK